MRRLTLAAFCGLLLVSACSTDSSTPAPTEPGADAVTAARCRPAPFPIFSLTTQIIKIFPVQGGLQANALVRMVGIGAFWSICRKTDAQNGVASFVKFMVQQFQLGKLIGGKNSGSSQRVLKLTNDLYSAVGLTPPQFPPEALGDGNFFGNGLFIPTQQAIIRTGNNEAAILIPPNGFTEPTLITIFLRSTSGFPPPPQPVFAPFYEITASNASGTHYLSGTGPTAPSAVVGFCADADFLATLGNPAIAHQAVAESPNPGGFEIIPSTTPAQYATLGLACTQAPNQLAALDVGGFKGFALAAWRRASHYVGPVIQSLLPDEAQAAAVMVAGKSGLGGLARSLSPFAVTDRGGNTLEFAPDPQGGEGDFRDPSGQEFETDDNEAAIQWFNYDHYVVPGVILRNSEGDTIGDEPVTVELIRTGELQGEFTEGSTTEEMTLGDGNSNQATGEALFDDLTVTNATDGFDEYGTVHSNTFKLRFTAAGAAPLESEEFTIHDPD